MDCNFFELGVDRIDTSFPRMPPQSKPLTLIVATTADLGIGLKGTLPWPSLKGEMGYFARVTKRVLEEPQNLSTSFPIKNAVIMGRKTWDSIPSRFRPLQGRINIVISRASAASQPNVPTQTTTDQDSVHFAPSLLSAISLVSANPSVARVFIIGGGTVYAAALSHPATQRVLLTKIRDPTFECDTFFPLDLDGDAGWRRAGIDELSRFTGEVFSRIEGKGTVRREAGVEYEFCLFERSNP